jgi:hypothetical protein
MVPYSQWGYATPTHPITTFATERGPAHLYSHARVLIEIITGYTTQQYLEEDLKMCSWPEPFLSALNLKTLEPLLAEVPHAHFWYLGQFPVVSTVYHNDLPRGLDCTMKDDDLVWKEIVKVLTGVSALLITTLSYVHRTLKDAHLGFSICPISRARGRQFRVPVLGPCVADLTDQELRSMVYGVQMLMRDRYLRSTKYISVYLHNFLLDLETTSDFELQVRYTPGYSYNTLNGCIYEQLSVTGSLATGYPRVYNEMWLSVKAWKEAWTT